MADKAIYRRFRLQNRLLQTDNIPVGLGFGIMDDKNSGILIRDGKGGEMKERDDIIFIKSEIDGVISVKRRKGVNRVHM